MSRFLSKVIWFLLPLFVGLAAVFWAVEQMAESRNEGLAVDTRITRLVLGDSHMQCAVNDSLFPGLRNAGQSSEVYAYSYEKLRFLHSKYPLLERVYLGVSYHSFSDYYDPFYSKEQIASRYFFSMPFEVQTDVLKRSDQAFRLLYLSAEEEWEHRNSDLESLPWLGHFREVVTAVEMDTARVEKRIALQFYSSGQLRSVSEFQSASFLKIVDYCRDHSLELRLLRTPVHPHYEDRVPEAFRAAFARICRKSGVALVDYRQLALEERHFLPDGDHLSPQGAEVFTRHLRELEAGK